MGGHVHRELALVQKPSSQGRIEAPGWGCQLTAPQQPAAAQQSQATEVTPAGHTQTAAVRTGGQNVFSGREDRWLTAAGRWPGWSPHLPRGRPAAGAAGATVFRWRRAVVSEHTVLMARCTPHLRLAPETCTNLPVSGLRPSRDLPKCGQQ